MFRTFIIGLCMFLWGSPHFEELRPRAIDVPLENFHYEVKDLASDTMRTGALLVDFHSLEFVRPQLSRAFDGNI